MFLGKGVWKAALVSSSMQKRVLHSGFSGIEYLQNDSIRNIKCTNACAISEKTADV